MPYKGELPVYIPDLERLTPEARKALEEGVARLNDGVVYWVKGSGNKGILQHLPFKHLGDFQAVPSEELLKIASKIEAAQSVVLAATAASTTVILAAIVIQTRYLAGKLDKIQQAVEEMSQDIHTQSILFYMDKVTQYFGSVEAARVLLTDRDLVDEISDVAPSMLGGMMTLRGQLVSLVDNILGLAQHSNMTERHFKLVVNFAKMILDLLPKGVLIESSLAARLGKSALSDLLLESGRRQYENGLGVYRNFLNDLYREIVSGRTAMGTILREHKEEAKALIESQENRLLLGM